MAKKATRTPIPISRALREIGTQLSTWRRLRGLTAAQVAERADISVRTLGVIESGAGSPTLENVLRVARALGVLEQIVQAMDPYSTDVGRMRSEEQLPRRVRQPRRRDDLDG